MVQYRNPVRTIRRMCEVHYSEISLSVTKLIQLWMMVILFSPGMSGYTLERTASKTMDYADQQGLVSIPVFDEFMVTKEVEATIGQTLLLPCTVRNLGDKVVSWIRSQDLHILTSGIHTFSSDSRFEPVHAVSGDFWGLRIRGVNVNDTGQYECQVNTDPKMSLAFQLTVRVPGVQNLESSNSKWVSRALIKGPKEVYVRDGSPVIFTCEISPLLLASPQSAAASPAHGFFVSSNTRLRWLHNDVEVQNGPTNMITQKTELNGVVISTLQFAFTTPQHSGRYTCMRPSAMPDTVKLFVIEEHSEAMQRDYPQPVAAATQNKPIVSLFLLVVAIHDFLMH